MLLFFLATRGLAFPGASQLIGDPNNGIFLGIVEFLAKWDPFIHEHVSCVQKFQSQHCRMQAHNLFPDSQNEFIAACSNLVMRHILDERKSAKYYLL